MIPDGTVFMMLFVLFLIVYFAVGYVFYCVGAPRPLLFSRLLLVCAATCLLLMIVPTGAVLVANALGFLGESLGVFFRWLLNNG